MAASGLGEPLAFVAWYCRERETPMRRRKASVAFLSEAVALLGKKYS